jgi:hypothetical protein
VTFRARNKGLKPTVLDQLIIGQLFSNNPYNYMIPHPAGIPQASRRDLGKVLVSLISKSPHVTVKSQGNTFLQLCPEFKVS